MKFGEINTAYANRTKKDERKYKRLLLSDAAPKHITLNKWVEERKKHLRETRFWKITYLRLQKAIANEHR